MFALPIIALVFLLFAYAAAWLLLVWLIVKYPIVGVPIAVYIGLVVWLGAHDAQALVCYALIVLAVWRLVHKRSFQRLVSRRLRSSWRGSWVYGRPVPRDHGAVAPGEAQPAAPAAVGSGEAPPPAPARPEEPSGRTRTVA